MDSFAPATVPTDAFTGAPTKETAMEDSIAATTISTFIRMSGTDACQSDEFQRNNGAASVAPLSESEEKDEFQRAFRKKKKQGTNERQKANG